MAHAELSNNVKREVLNKGMKDYFYVIFILWNLFAKNTYI